MTAKGNIKRILVAVVIITAVAFLYACTDGESPLELYVKPVAEDYMDYKEISLSEKDSSFEGGRVLRVFENGDKRVYYASGKGGYNGDIEIVVLVEKAVIIKIAGYNVKESPDYGAKCFNEPFMQQFYGMDLSVRDEVTWGRAYGGDFDVYAVTHATYTTKAFVYAVNAVRLYIQA